MTQTYLTGLGLNAWLSRIDDLCEESGFFEQLGVDHCAAFQKGSDRLLVTFESADTIRSHNAYAEPRGLRHARQEGWSQLAIISYTESWFRDPAIYDFFDRLIDDGFFEGFEKVVFHGAHGGGYAAAAFSVAAPSATVIALRPQATLDPGMTGWDPRYKAHRHSDFTGRYGYAPEMIDAAEQVFVAYDPYERLDAIHAALFRKPHVALLPCALIGTGLDHALDRLGIHDATITLAMEGTLDRQRFMQLLRARRYDETYARALINQLLSTNHKRFGRLICEYMLQRGQSPFFAKTLQELADQRPFQT